MLNCFAHGNVRFSIFLTNAIVVKKSLGLNKSDNTAMYLRKKVV